MIHINATHIYNSSRCGHRREPKRRLTHLVRHACDRVVGSGKNPGTRTLTRLLGRILTALMSSTCGSYPLSILRYELHRSVHVCLHTSLFLSPPRGPTILLIGTGADTASACYITDGERDLFPRSGGK